MASIEILRLTLVADAELPSAIVESLRLKPKPPPDDESNALVLPPPPLALLADDDDDADEFESASDESEPSWKAMRVMGFL